MSGRIFTQGSVLMWKLVSEADPSRSRFLPAGRRVNMPHIQCSVGKERVVGTVTAPGLIWSCGFVGQHRNAEGPCPRSREQRIHPATDSNWSDPEPATPGAHVVPIGALADIRLVWESQRGRTGGRKSPSDAVEVLGL